MTRALRYQYPCAVYHLMARGDGGKAVFETDADRKGSVSRLVVAAARDPKRMRELEKLAKLLKCDT